MSDAVRLVEVFSSLQGEGILVGHRQVFVRTFGCNLRCSYCDSPETLKESGSPPTCRVEEAPGSWTFRRVPNPVPAADLTEIVRGYLTEPHHSLSVTGGEPLLHAEFLARWLPSIRALGLKVFIETNGLLPDHLKRILPLVDYVSMDFKAPTATGVAPEATWAKHREFLAVARAVNVYGKFVVTPGATEAELDAVIALIREVDPSIPLILQPVTPFGYEPRPVEPARMIALHARAARCLQEVRVIPQTHKMLHLL
ncbi:MAG TPA: 7-carboxy-7-deazaguanine synthase QueE [Chthonomonadaceae bacterium]|nr:7-carboxy-7-deazaguanine synthase QueE [Chthonomonadaceae bacterium]